MADKYTLQARELLADEAEKQYCPTTAGSYRNGDYDDAFATAVLARVLREQPPQPTFEQRVEAMKRTFLWSYEGYQARQEEYDRHLAEIMAPKVVDPLVEAMNASLDRLGAFDAEEADNLRKALADRGLKIVPEEAA